MLASPHPPREAWGIDIQDVHLRKARAVAQRHHAARVHLKRANIFTLDLKVALSWRTSGPLLVLGNPPWVTNAELSSLGSSNLPEKMNFKKLRGIDAMTGGSNFDIAEYIWLKLVRELVSERPTIALLCKTTVARNVLRFAHDNRLPISNAAIRHIDAQRYFGAAVDACLFSIDVGETHTYDANVYDNLEAPVPSSTIGLVRGRMVSSIRRYASSAYADGSSPVVWRQGVKHDVADVMELFSVGETLKNKLGETVDVEAECVYPLLKSSDLRSGGPPRFSVLLTQHALGDNTSRLQSTAPKLWRYLMRHSARFASRKSSIYRRQFRFAMFGIGDYSFAPYKVAISGLHKSAVFRLIGPIDRRAVMLDDTCYFVPFDSATEAALTAALLDSPETHELIESLAFWDSKRPITKALLQRLDLLALLLRLPPESVLLRATEHLRKLSLEHPLPLLEAELTRMASAWQDEGAAQQLLLLEGRRSVALRAARVR